MKLTSDLKKYFKSIKRGLKCSFKVRIEFASMLKNRVDDFLFTHENATIEDVIINFGTPESITREFHANTNNNEFKKEKNTLFILSILISITSILALSGLFFAQSLFAPALCFNFILWICYISFALVGFFKKNILIKESKHLILSFALQTMLTLAFIIPLFIDLYQLADILSNF